MCETCANVPANLTTVNIFDIAVINQNISRTINLHKPFILPVNHDIWTKYVEIGGQEFNCNACKPFIRNFSRLAYFSGDKLMSALWGDPDDESNPAASLAKQALATRRDLNVDESAFKYFDKVDTYGTAFLNDFEHYSVTLDGTAICKHTKLVVRAKVIINNLIERAGGVAELTARLGKLTAWLAKPAQDGVASGDLNIRIDSIHVLIASLSGNSTLQHAAAWVGSNKPLNNSQLKHFFTTPFGEMVKQVATGMNVEDAYMHYLRQTDPSKFRIVSDGKITAAAIESLREAYGESVLDVYNLRLATADDFDDVLYQSAPVVEPASSLFDKAIDKFDAPVKPEPTLLPGVLNVTWAKFVEQVLPNVTNLNAHIDSTQHWHRYLAFVEKPRISVLDERFDRRTLAVVNAQDKSRFLNYFDSINTARQAEVDLIFDSLHNNVVHITWKSDGKFSIPVPDLSGALSHEFVPHRAAFSGISRTCTPIDSNCACYVGVVFSTKHGGITFTAVSKLDGNKRTYEIIAEEATTLLV